VGALGAGPGGGRVDDDVARRRMRLGGLWLAFAAVLLLSAAALATVPSPGCQGGCGTAVAATVLRACLVAGGAAGMVGLVFLAVGWKRADAP